MTKILYLFSLLPFRVLYVLSDILSFVAYHIVGYRRRVVHENLTSSFPEKSEKEIRRIERGFYRFLGDYFVETLKLFSISEKEMKKRMRFEGMELIDEAVAEGRSVTVYLGHLGNWEWVSSLPQSVAPGTTCAQIYHPLENKSFDEMMGRIRTRFGAVNIPMAEAMKRLIGWKKEGVPSVTGFIADQAPGMNIHLFLDFLNHETGVYTGPERIAKFMDSRVLYAHISRPRRGFYVMRAVKITDTPKKEDIFEISRRYFALLEQNIREYPSLWLWSHRRWKRTRAMFDAYHGDKAADMLSHL